MDVKFMRLFLIKNFPRFTLCLITKGFLRKRRPLDGSSYSRAKKFKSSRLNKEFKKEKKAVIVREK